MKEYTECGDSVANMSILRCDLLANSEEECQLLGLAGCELDVLVSRCVSHGVDVEHRDLVVLTNLNVT